MARQIRDNSDHLAKTTSKAMIDQDVIFNITGDVQILSLSSECYSANDGTGTRIKYTVHSALDGDTDISGLCATLANAVIGTRIICDNNTLSNAPNVVVGGVSIGMDSRGIISPRGYLKLTVNNGSTTGLWRHYIRYELLEQGATITPAF